MVPAPAALVRVIPPVPPERPKELAPTLLPIAITLPPVEPFAIFTAPVEVPVFILLAKLEEAFKFTAAPVTVSPAEPVMSPEIVGVAVQEVGPIVKLEPLIVVAPPLLPKVRPV